MVGTLADGDRGNSATLIKVDRLRELIGNKISLPQLVVVGDQSSGKSSVLEGITGFAFPRDAELCTRYATQITCRREDYESVTVTIIPNEDADPDVAAKLKSFSRTLPEVTQMDNDMLGEIFKDVNKDLGVSSGSGDIKTEAGNAFSEHLLKIEICGPQQRHFTVIDVPGIFRKETQGVTTEADILLVKNMVMKYMRDPRTIILAIVPANVDPATQEILKLAKEVDPDMKRTMGVLTKPDLAIERAMQQIAINHVTGKRSDLTLGYYIVKNRGSDDENMTLGEGRKAEVAFFAKEPWSAIKDTGRAGTKALQIKVRGLLTDLVKQEFKQLRMEVVAQLASLGAEELALGPQRSDANSQRAYLSNLMGTREEFLSDKSDDSYAPKCDEPFPMLNQAESWCPSMVSTARDLVDLEKDVGSIMEYIEEVYRKSRGADLGTFNGSIIAAVFQEQTKNWEPITKAYIQIAKALVQKFIQDAFTAVCPDENVRDEVSENILQDRLDMCFRQADKHAKRLLDIERKNRSFTLNHYFNETLSKLQGNRLADGIKNVASLNYNNHGETLFKLSQIQLDNLVGQNNKSNLEHMHQYIHDVLKSYYKVALKRYIDNVCLQVVHHELLYSADSPLYILTPKLIHTLDDDQLEQYAGEDHAVRAQREKLARDIQNFKEALEVLKGTSKASM
ncbi:hypothetical protein MAPG_09727 [Magnaporthiopsis poae ATCC 64411]|uniref:Interferon-induced GTP-binding protein Mx1 n=1 Tax=Magnaporthiopsis poae (strain ATCC 64411 / 73-15) TaxID=644358 RepID=A0A0C4EAQ0_MAGP6|nr:hypothetical protein MAPG_09727 [Magnaporthiopsis poae ATCC 64411]